MQALSGSKVLQLLLMLDNKQVESPVAQKKVLIEWH